MSMGPALWLVNFLLLYILNPALAAAMPADWAPIPPNRGERTTGEPHRPGSLHRLRVAPRLTAVRENHKTLSGSTRVNNGSGHNSEGACTLNESAPMTR